MASEITFGKTVASMKANINSTRNTVREPTHIQMEANTAECGSMACNME